MSILDSFVSYNFNAGVPYVSITNNGMTFNKAVVIKLGYPRHVVLLVDAEDVYKRQLMESWYNG